MLPLRRWQRRRSGLLAAALLAALLLSLASWTVLVLLVLAWLVFTGSLLAQNTRHAAHLVPGFARQLRLVLAAGWLVAVLLQSALLHWGFGRGLTLQLWCALGLVGSAVTVRYPWSWLVLWIPLTFAGWWLRLLPVRDTITALQAWAVAQPVTAWLATLVLGLAVLPTLVAGRGQATRPARHGPPALWRGLADFLRRQGMRLYHWRMRRLCARPGRAPVARALLVLGSAHWTSQATAALVVAATATLVVAALWASGLIPWPGMRRAQFIGAALGLMSFAVNPLLQSVAGLLRTRREQALLVLLPGLPRGPAFNRALALQLSLSFGIAWAGATVLALALVGLEGQVSRVVQAVTFGILPFVAWFWRDWSRLSTQTAGRTLLPVAAMMATVLLLAWALKHSSLGLPALAVSSFALTAALLAWGWRRAGRLPQAWPVAREGGG
jgi:hypothetical protein